MNRTGRFLPEAVATSALRWDILAGLTLWGVLVPEGLAYAGMAGMPVQAGLYTLLVSLPLYFLLGKSPVLVCAATSSESILMAAVVAPLAFADPARYAILTALLILTTGVLFLAAGLCRLGRVASFLSKPVMTGFVFGLAIFISANQLHKILGLPRGHGDIFMQLLQMGGSLGHCNPVTVCVGGTALLLLYILERYAPRIPAGLCIMALGIGASRLFELSLVHGVAIVHTFKPGLPDLVVPAINLKDVLDLAPAAAGLALVAFSQAIGAVESYAEKSERHADADRELIALGAANVASSFVGGLLAGGSMSSTAVNMAAGARSKLSTLVTACMVLLTVCFFTPVFQELPEAILGAVVMHAVFKLMKVSEMRRYLALNPIEFVLAMIALLGVVFLDILPGLALSVVASLLRLIMYASKVEVAVLGAVDSCSRVWLNTTEHPQAIETPGVRVLRLDRPLFFANAEGFRARIDELRRKEPKAKAVVLQMAGNMRLCVTGADMIASLARSMRGDGVQLAFVDPAPKVLQALRANGIFATGGEEHVYRSVDEAVAKLAGLPPKV